VGLEHEGLCTRRSQRDPSLVESVQGLRRCWGIAGFAISCRRHLPQPQAAMMGCMLHDSPLRSSFWERARGQLARISLLSASD